MEIEQLEIFRND